MKSLLVAMLMFGCFSAQASTIRCAIVSSLISAKEYTVNHLDITNPVHRYSMDVVLDSEKSHSFLVLDSKLLDSGATEEVRLSIFRDTFHDGISAGIYRVRRSARGFSSTPERSISFDENAGPVSLSISNVLKAGALDIDEEIVRIGKGIIQNQKGLFASKNKSEATVKAIADAMKALSGSQWLKIGGVNSTDMNMVCRKD